jgi:hypothetical protein
VERNELIAVLTETLANDPRVRGAWLTGSIARGTDDEYSDVDVVIAVDAASAPAIADDWPARAGRLVPLVLCQRLAFGDTAVFTHITPDWLRFDVTICPRQALSRYSAASLRELFAHEAGMTASCDQSGGTGIPASKAGEVERIVTEFLRVLGLLPVVLGRGDHVAAASGATLLRGLLIQLMLAEVPDDAHGGALRLAANISPERYAVLAALPPIEATRESAIAAHLACARAFLPLAHDLATRFDATYPLELERAALNHLARRLALQLDPREATT